MSDLNQPRGKVRLICCGGAGVNIGLTLDGRSPKDDLAYATLDNSYIDTSKSNLMRKEIDPAKVYLIGLGSDGEERDGAGKFRKEHFEAIKDCTNDILQKHQPGDLTITIGSASGGSGSVIAPLITRALLKAGKPVISILIGTAASKTEIQNTLDTISSYEGIIEMLRMPVTLAYFENSPSSPRNEVNNAARKLIASLTMLYSRQNAELDSQDLFNWLFYDRRTSFEPQLSALQILSHEERSQVEGEVISVATLTSPDKDTTLETVPEYHCEGFVTNASREVGEVLPRHYFITSNFFTRTQKKLQKQIDQFDQARDARTKRVTIPVSSDRRDDDTGMVV